jgi:acetaldehyde dehydrogenase (acetylating)
MLNPTEPPLIMRDTVLALVCTPDQDAIRRSIYHIFAKSLGLCAGLPTQA